MTEQTPRTAARDFRDEGTGRFFAKGEPVEVNETTTAGAIENYDAAGLLTPIEAEAEPTPPADAGTDTGTAEQDAGGRRSRKAD